MPLEYIDRPPRIQPELPIAELDLPAPPDLSASGSTTGIVGLIIPLITMIAFLFASGTGNLLLMIPIGLAMVASIGASIYTSLQEQQKRAAKKKAYLERLAELRQEMARSHNTQRLFYQHNYPDIATVLEIAARKETSRFGSRLWERRPTDRDFGDVRLGLGSRPSTVIYQLPQTGGSDDNPLWKDALKLAEDSRLLSNAVVTLPLRPYAEPNSFEVKVPARHSVGVFGKNPVNAADFGPTLLEQLKSVFANFPGDSEVMLVMQTRSGQRKLRQTRHALVRGGGQHAWNFRLIFVSDQGGRR